MKVLALDTATERCSAALLVRLPGGGTQLHLRELPPGPQHSAHILSLVQAVLAEGAVRLTDLSCIAFGRGPGGFTGVRLAASVTQGLAFGADLPVVPVSDLLAVAQQALDSKPAAEGVLVCNDARMQELYWAVARRGPDGLALAAGPEAVGPAQAVTLSTAAPAAMIGAGRGFTVFPQLAERLKERLQWIEPELLPRAQDIARLGAAQWEQGQTVSAAQALPVYLRDEVAKPSRQ